MTPQPQFSAKRHLGLALLTLAVLVVGFGLWASMTRISGAVIAPAQIEVEQARQILQHPDGGVVEAIYATEGRPVAAGDVVMRLEGARLQSEFKLVEARFFEVLARRGRLEAERDQSPAIAFPQELLDIRAARPDLAAQISALMEGQEQLMQARRMTISGLVTQLEQRLAQIDTQVEGITSQLAALDEQLDLILQERETQNALLEQGLTQAARVLALDRETARLRGGQGALMSDRAAAGERRAEIMQQILSLEAQRREEAEAELRDISGLELEFSERRRALAEQIDRLELRAPVSGVVYGLQVTTPRAVLRPAEPALYIVPQDRPLVIVARANPADIDLISLGQKAVVYFAGLNMRNLPQIDAEVFKISADVFTDSAGFESYYRVELALTDEAIAILGPQTLLPGMPLEVFLQTGERSPLSYLTRPLTDYFNRAMRET